MDRDLELTPQDQQSLQQPEVIVQAPAQQLNTDELFAKLLNDKQMNWTQVMAEVVDWVDLKYTAEQEELNLLSIFPTFNSFISGFYADLK